MKVKLRTLFIVWVILFSLTLWLFVDSLSASITRPLIPQSELKWSSYHAYKLLFDSGDIIKTKDVQNLIESAWQNEAWAKRTAKRLNLRKLKPRKRVLRILRYIARIYTYDITARFVDDSIETGFANCASYSDTMYILCKVSGIPVRYIIGYDHGICHAWCRVKVNKKWYWSDPTRFDGLGDIYAFKSNLWTGYSNIIEEW